MNTTHHPHRRSDALHLLVVGGTGTAGRVLATRAAAAGHRVRVLSRQPARPHPTEGVETATGDLVDGRGLRSAVAGTDVVIDLSDTVTSSRRRATAFCTTATDRLLDAEEAAGVGHHHTVSIVGVDRFPSPYYRAKVAQEAAVRAGAERTRTGWTIARVAQFHDFAATVADRFRLGRLVLAPPLRVQPVHLDDVADHLLRLVSAGPSGYAEELGGPQDEVLTDMVRRYVAAVRAPLRVRPLPLPGAAGHANRAAVLRPAAGARGLRTFDDWLRELSCSVQPRRGRQPDAAAADGQPAALRSPHDDSDHGRAR